jgi:hypothetical protein
LPLASPFRSGRRVQPSDSWPDTAPASPSLACRPAGSETARKPVHFPMQKVIIRPDPSVYAGSREFIYFWRLTGDLILPTCPADRVRVT